MSVTDPPYLHPDAAHATRYTALEWLPPRHQRLAQSISQSLPDRFGRAGKNLGGDSPASIGVQLLPRCGTARGGNSFVHQLRRGGAVCCTRGRRQLVIRWCQAPACLQFYSTMTSTKSRFYSGKKQRLLPTGVRHLQYVVATLATEAALPRITNFARHISSGCDHHAPFNRGAPRIRFPTFVIL